jgi:hypothetical protein
MPTIDYIIGGDPLSIELPGYTQVPDCGYAVEYTPVTDPSDAGDIVSIDDNEPASLVIDSDDLTDEGTIEVGVIAEVDGVSDDSLELEVDIKPFVEGC